MNRFTIAEPVSTDTAALEAALRTVLVGSAATGCAYVGHLEIAFEHARRSAESGDCGSMSLVLRVDDIALRTRGGASFSAGASESCAIAAALPNDLRERGWFKAADALWFFTLFATSRVQVTDVSVSQQTLSLVFGEASLVARWSSSQPGEIWTVFAEAHGGVLSFENGEGWSSLRLG